MKYIRRVVYGLLTTAMMNYIPLFTLACLVSGRAIPFTLFWYWPLLAAFLYINVRPLPRTAPTRRIQRLAEGAELLQLFLIAHSKGGLDSRAAIAHCGMAPYVATLTTINTPHRGCIFAEYLLGKVPQATRQKIASAYNAAMQRVGDPNPDFLAADLKRRGY